MKKRNSTVQVTFSGQPKAFFAVNDALVALLRVAQDHGLDANVLLESAKQDLREERAIAKRG